MARDFSGRFNARVATPLTPTVRGIFEHGDMVIVLFEADTAAIDGLPSPTPTPGTFT